MTASNQYPVSIEPALADVVEMGRTTPDCVHGRNVWCNHKVYDLAVRMVDAGWTPPHSGSTQEDDR